MKYQDASGRRRFASASRSQLQKLLAERFESVTSIARKCRVKPATISALACGKNERPTLDLGLDLQEHFKIDARGWKRPPPSDEKNDATKDDSTPIDSARIRISA